jgi:hypothetical protein
VSAIAGKNVQENSMIKRCLFLTMICTLTACATNTGVRVSEEDTQLNKAVISHNQTVKPADKLVCKRERPTGSRLTKKICRTQSQIDAERAAGKKTMDKIRTGSTMGGGEG